MNYCDCGKIPSVVYDGRYQCVDCLIATVRRLGAAVDQLPKCWRLINGKLERSRPMVPGMGVWGVGSIEGRAIVVSVGIATADLVRDRIEWARDLADSQEAAEAVRKERE